MSLKKVLIIGAGWYGEKIYREIQSNNNLKYLVCGFVDDDQSKIGKTIDNIPILGPVEHIKSIGQKTKVNEIIIAISSASSAQMRRIVAFCIQSGIPYKIIPGMGELINGKVSAKAIRDVAYRDLLGREVIRLNENLIGAYLKNAKVLVTGAGGSIGSELCKQICRFKPLTLILYERSENSLYEIDLELRKNFPDINIISMLADIRHLQQVSVIFDQYRPQIVFHAAAYKHVPMLELQPWEAVLNNIMGTQNMVEAAKKYNTELFLFVSTDKAVNPTSIMGATKRVAEMIVQGQDVGQEDSIRFITVRFGNVIGSAGSVIPLFKKQIEKGGPVTVTHPDIIRYFMTIPEACQLILQAGAMGKGGEIFVLKMGNPIKIDDMARDLIRFSGFEPDIDIKIEYIGIRPGEKLYEELITEGEGIVPTEHDKIMVLRGHSYKQILLNGQIDALIKLAYQHDFNAIKTKLKDIVPEYINVIDQL